MNSATFRTLATAGLIVALLVAAGPVSGVIARDEQYEQAMDALDDRDWRDAIELLRQVEGRGGDRADAAVYWQAYAMGKLGRVDSAVQAVDRLNARYPDSEWRDDGRKLLAELRGDGGSEISDDDIKIAALTSLVHSDPDRAIPMLRKFLSGGSSNELKEQALFLLIQTGDAEALKITAELARNSDSELQSSAIHSLGVLGGERSFELLSGLYDDLEDAEVKSEVLHSFMMSGHLKPIFEAAKSERSEELREDAIHLLGMMGATAELNEIYENESGVEVRESILHSFMMSGDEARVLDAARNEESAELRESAVHLLGMMGALDELWELYQRETSRDVRESVLHSLAMGGDVERLGQVAREEDDAELREAAIHALGMTGGERVNELMLQIYESESDREVRASVLHSLAMQGNVQALIRIARTEKDRELKLEAVRALSMTGSKDATDFLMEMLESE